MALQQPTWCKLRPENFGMLADSADLADAPENVLFLLSQPAHQASSSGAKAGASSGIGSSNSSSSVRDSSSSSSSSGVGSVSSRPSNSSSGNSDAVERAEHSNQAAAPVVYAASGAPVSRSAAARIQPLRH